MHEVKKMEVGSFVRHGDLLIEMVAEIPDGATPVQGGILQRGEATGHAHRVDTRAELYEKDGLLFFGVKKDAEGTSLTHEEHARIDLPKGFFRVIRQVEYEAPEVVRQVAD